jgi:hypothetical protein
LSEAARQRLLDPGRGRLAGVSAQGRNVDPDVPHRKAFLRQRGFAREACDKRKRAASRNRDATVAFKD